MAREFTPATFRVFCEQRARNADPLLASYVEWYGLQIFGIAKAKYGDAGQLQPYLALSTQATRVRLGYTASDTLLRTGSLKDSLEFEHWGLVAAIGTSDVRMLWAELGTSTQPPRPLLRRSAQELSLPAWIQLRRYTAEIVGVNVGGGGVVYAATGTGSASVITPNTGGLIQLTSAMNQAKGLAP